jgi:hypothetical protein
MHLRLQQDYRLPNGVVLHPGGRVRVPADLIWSIPEADVVAYGIELDDEEASPGSEVLVRPALP